LFGNPAQPVFTCRGLDRRSQPDVAHHVFARWEAGHGAQHEHRREGRQRAHAGMGHEAPRSGVGVGGLLDLVIQIRDVSIEPAQELETLASPTRRVGRQRERLELRDSRAGEER
jgi:hypothetical protein